jgi:hypothetical protein
MDPLANVVSESLLQFSAGAGAADLSSAGALAVAVTRPATTASMDIRKEALGERSDGG